MFLEGKSYTITIRGLENLNYFDYEYVKLSQTIDATNANTSFDYIYAHDGKTSTSVVNVSDFSAVVVNETTLTITFTGSSKSKNHQLFIVFDESKNVA
jgi:hypothetical protein